MLEVLEANPDYVVVENAEEWDDDEKQPVPAPGEVLKIPGSVVSFVDRLDDELTRSLQHIDPHTTEYIDRLSDEGALYTTILRNQLYLERLQRNQNIPTDEAINRVIMRRLEHLYFKVMILYAPFLVLLELTIRSLSKSSSPSKKMHGSRFLMASTLRSRPGGPPLLLAISCTLSAHTFTNMMLLSFVHALCFATSTIMPFTTNSTRPAI